jgi:hypothetical protein
MKNDRRITIAFTDGTDMQFEFPKQIDDASKIATALRKTLSENQLVLAVEGAMYTIPFSNVKYIRVSPCPDKLPETAILGVRLKE